MYKTWFTSICLLIISLFSCQPKEKGFKTLSVDEFADVINDPDVQRLDVRTVAEYSEGHIPGSLSGKRSKKAARILSGKGFRIYELSTGFNGWKEAGQPVEK